MYIQIHPKSLDISENEQEVKKIEMSSQPSSTPNYTWREGGNNAKALNFGRIGRLFSLEIISLYSNLLLGFLTLGGPEGKTGLFISLFNNNFSPTLRKY